MTGTIWAGRHNNEPEARLKSDPSKPIFERHIYWCPECDGELADPQGSGDVWHHYFGRRGDCTWTD